MIIGGVRRGRLVAIEGIDGTGKSTLARRLAIRWRRRGHVVRLVREPAHPDLARFAGQASTRDPWGSALLFTLDRALLRDSIAALLEHGTWVVQDRSYFSTLAYQGSALAPSRRRWLVAAQRAAALDPDLVIWLDLPVAEALSRIGRRASTRSLLETRRTLDRAQRAYRRLARSPRWVRLDATQPRERLVGAAERAMRSLRPVARGKARATR